MQARVLLTPLPQNRRLPRGSSLGLVVGAAAVAFATLVGLLIVGSRGSAPGPDSQRRLLVLAAAGLREPMEELAAAYQRGHAVRVDLQFGGSNSLLNQLQVDRISSPDLFLAADQSYTRLAIESRLANEMLAVATQRPVVIVRKDSPIRIDTVDDLWAGNIRLSIADPEQAAIGRTVKASLSALSSDHWTRLQQQVQRWGVFKPTVNDVAGDVQIGAVDAGIVWDTTVSAPAYESTLKVIDLAELSRHPEEVTLAVLLSSTQPEEAWKFARYLTDPERGQQVFSSHGFGSLPRASDAANQPRKDTNLTPGRPTLQQDGSE